MNAKARTIRETSEVVSAVDAASAKYPRFNDGWEAWTWKIARGPMLGYEHKGYLIFKSYDAHSQYGVPETTILYKIIDEGMLEIISVFVK